MTNQQTISKEVEMIGTNIFLGYPLKRRDSKINFFPAKEDNGIVFHYNGHRIPATLSNVYSPNKLRTSFASCIGLDNGKKSIFKVEHILAHLYAMGIDNLDIVLEDSVVPRFDNGGQEVFENLEGLIINQDKDRELWDIGEDYYLNLRSFGDQVYFRKNKGTSIGCAVIYPHKSIGIQELEINFNDIETYKREIMKARGIFFLPFTSFMSDKFVDNMREVSELFGYHGITDKNSLLIGGVQNPNVLNPNGYGKEEFVRHKIQDAIGLLALSQKRFSNGSIFHYKTGHRSDLEAWKLALNEDGVFKRVN